MFPNLDVAMFLDVKRVPTDTTASDVLVSRFLHDFERQEWPDDTRLPRIYYDPRFLAENPAQRSVLHAKCIVADGTEIFISSANFTEAAQMRSIEVGIRIRSELMATKATDFFNTLVAASMVRRIK